MLTPVAGLLMFFKDGPRHPYLCGELPHGVADRYTLCNTLKQNIKLIVCPISLQSVVVCLTSYNSLYLR
jgi:hypothetical protein